MKLSGCFDRVQRNVKIQTDKAKVQKQRARFIGHNALNFGRFATGKKIKFIDDKKVSMRCLFDLFSNSYYLVRFSFFYPSRWLISFCFDVCFLSRLL